jgi:hypothetical protein
MTFIPNPAFEAELAVASKALMVEAASQAQGKAEALAHHAMPRKGQPRIKVDFDGDDVVLANTNHGGVIEEFGGAGVRSPTYAPLRRGVRAAGFKLHES